MQTILSLTLSGSALALLLLALRYVFIKRMPSTVYYYAWILVLLRFALPLPGLVPMERAASTAYTPISSTRTLSFAEQNEPLPFTPPSAGFVPVTAVTAEANEPATLNPPSQERAEIPSGRSAAVSAPKLLLAVWLLGTGISLAAYVVSYKVFTVRVRRSLSSATADDRRVYRLLPGRKPRLYRCAAFQTPLMFGVFRPLITLPERVYDEELLTNILRHELMHYHRRDTLYKWFAVAVLSTQWFNPLSYLIRREINRACELSCDEMLLRDMDRADKISYGNTLLNMASAGALPAGVVATTFSTEKRNLKERLEQIMNYKKSGARLLAAVLTLVLLAGCGVAAGAAPARTSPVTDSAKNTVRVSTVDELLDAIAPDTTIELAAGTYDLSTASNYRQASTNPFYTWNEVYDNGAELEIRGVKNFTIRGAGKDSTTIAAVPRYANVLKFTGCQDVTVDGLTAGHTTEPGWCMGGVLYFDTCDRAAVNACGLYGCGTIGVWAGNCNDLTVTASDIYECSYGAVYVDHCRNARVEGCDVHDHGTRSGEGSAMTLFDASYSDGFVIHGTRVHDNRAQMLLRCDYTKGAQFLSNDVTGNSFDSPVFYFQQYGATVDGCRFEGNNIHAWYSGDVYAGDIEGNLLEGALLGEMILRNLDPDTASPLNSTADPTEVSKGGSISVTNVDDFLAAIGPDRTIILDGALFDLSTASNYGGIGTAYYYWSESYDGPQLVIHDVSGLSITAKDTSSGATTLAAIPRYADVLCFRNCDNLYLGGFTAGHTKEPGACSGGVLDFQNCNQVRIEKMRLYGCGILGLQTHQCTSLDVLRTEIYECSQGAGMFFQTDGIVFSDCDIHDVPSPALIFNECGDKVWNGEPLLGLNGTYDMAEDGSLAEYAAESYYNDESFHNIEPGDYEYTFLREVQQNIVEGDWETLAGRISYPVSFLYPAYGRSNDRIVVNDREEFLNLPLDEVFEADYRDYVANATIGEIYPVPWGFLSLDNAVAYAYAPDPQEGSTLSVPKITAFFISASRAVSDITSLSYLENPFNFEPPYPFETGTPQWEFAVAVQREIADRNWNSLADKISYPVQIVTFSGSATLPTRQDFLDNADTLFTPEFCDLIEKAPLDEYGSCIFGSTFCAHRLAFSCYTDQLRSLDDLKINCISTAQPLYEYAYAQAVPPTPAP